MASEVFTTSLGKLILGDARKVLKELPGGGVDAIITDPPWGMGLDQYDNFNAFLEVVPELYRVLKRDAWLVFFIGTKRVLDLHPLKRYFDYKWMISCIYPKSSTSRNPLGSEVSHTPVMVFAKGSPRVYHKRSDIVFAEELPIVEKTPDDPQFKPTAAVAALISMFTKEGDLVLDPFAGYGSIPLVCELFNRRWVAVEIDPLKFEIAKKLISEKKVENIKELKKKLQKALPTNKGLKTLTEWRKQ